jgi:hypothetical protein
MMVGRGRSLFGEAVALATATRLGAGDARYRIGGTGPVDTVYLGAWRREVFDRVGLFDEGLERNQDYELCLRIKEAGGSVWLDPSIRTETITRSDPGALARQYYGYGKGRAGTVSRHPGSLRLRQLVPAVAVLTALIGLPAALVWRPARMVMYAAVGAYCALVAVTTLRAAHGRDPRHYVALPMAFVTMHVSWGLGFWRGLIDWLTARRA